MKKCKNCNNLTQTKYCLDCYADGDELALKGGKE